MAGGYVTLSALTAKGFQVEFLSHAEAILTVDFPSALTELEAVLSELTIPIEQLVRGGGGETETTQGLRRALATHGWVKHNFEIKKLIDDVPRESISHEVDHVRSMPKGTIALEIEWNNKRSIFRSRP
jgi:Restriction endonuclease BglII